MNKNNQRGIAIFYVLFAISAFVFLAYAIGQSSVSNSRQVEYRASALKMQLQLSTIAASLTQCQTQTAFTGLPTLDNVSVRDSTRFLCNGGAYMLSNTPLEPPPFGFTQWFYTKSANSVTLRISADSTLPSSDYLATLAILHKRLTGCETTNPNCPRQGGYSVAISSRPRTNDTFTITLEQ